MFALMHVFAQIFFFRTGGDAFSQKIERSLSIFFSDSFVVYSCTCHVLLAEAPLSELILRFAISCYIYHAMFHYVYRIGRETEELYLLY